MNARPLTVALPLALVVLLTCGCQNQSQIELRRQVAELTARVEEQEDRLLAQQSTIEQQRKQIDRIRGWTEQDFAVIYTPVKIEIEGLSGGEDYDGVPGDDGMTVYLKPIDDHGDTLKVAGDIRIELYDLQNPEGQKLIGEYAVPAKEVAKYWYGRLATYHYTIRCPWRDGPPRHNEITIRATFVDYLTQRVMTTQTVRNVRLAP